MSCFIGCAPKPMTHHLTEMSLPQKGLEELLQEISPEEKLDPKVESLLLELADDFVDSVASFSCALAKHRNSNTLDVQDVQLHLEKNWGIRSPGFVETTVPSAVKSQQNKHKLDVHRQRLELIRKEMQNPKASSSTSKKSRSSKGKRKRDD